MIHVEQVMGTAVRFVVDGDADVAAAVAWLHWVDRTFSTYRDDSEIMRLRSGTLAEDGVHPEVAAVLDRCAGLRILTDGAFDHRPEDALDPSGYVKGWAIQRAARLLSDDGVDRFYVDAGGDMAVRGSWRIGVKHPVDHDRAALVLDLTDRAIATSGTYERGDHIWGTSGGLASVSVIGSDLGTADALSTALFSCGGRETGWMDRFPGYEVVAITTDLEMRVSPGVRSLVAAH